MSKSERDRREAESAARRAQRLAQRAERRAIRKGEQAARASERADRLAERAKRKPRRERDLEDSIEDLVDEVTEKWSRKAEDWIGEHPDGLRGQEPDRAEDAHGRAEAAARKARRDARRLSDDAERRVHDLEEDDLDDEEELTVPPRSSRRRRRRIRAAQSAGSGRAASRRLDGARSWGQGWGDRVRSRRHRHGRRTGNLYRDSRKGKVCGVCAGAADYFGIETWQLRLCAVMGLIFIPQVTVPAYFCTYFLMDDKPYYRRVTDRFENLVKDSPPDDDHEQRREQPMTRQKSREPRFNNVQAMRTAKEKFSDIEERLRAMETHVTSSRFELQREINKISGEEAS